MTEDQMVGWHHQLDGHEFEKALGVGQTGKPGVLQSMGSQRVGHELATEHQQQWGTLRSPLKNLASTLFKFSLVRDLSGG